MHTGNGASTRHEVSARAGAAPSDRPIVKATPRENRIGRERAAAARMMRRGTSDSDDALDEAVVAIQREILRDGRPTIAVESKLKPTGAVTRVRMPSSAHAR